MLNLLPPEIKHSQKYSSVVYSLVLAYFVTVIVLGLGLAGLLTYSYVLGSSIGERQTTINQLTKERQRNQKLISKAAFIQDRLAAEGQFQEVNDWRSRLELIASLTPVDIRLTNLKLASTNNQGTTVDISGESFDRRSIVLFKDKLSGAKDVTAAEISSLTETLVENKKVFAFAMKVTIK